MADFDPFRDGGAIALDDPPASEGFDPFKAGAIPLDDEPFDPFKAGAIPVDEPGPSESVPAPRSAVVEQADAEGFFTSAAPPAANLSDQLSSAIDPAAMQPSGTPAITRDDLSPMAQLRSDREAPRSMWEAANTGALVLPRSEGTGVGSGVVNALADQAEGLTSPLNIGTLALAGAGKVALKVAGTVFGAQAAKGVGEQLSAIRNAETPAETARAITNAALGGVFAAGGVKVATMRPGGKALKAARVTDSNAARVSAEAALEPVPDMPPEIPVAVAAAEAGATQSAKALVETVTAEPYQRPAEQVLPDPQSGVNDLGTPVGDVTQDFGPLPVKIRDFDNNGRLKASVELPAAEAATVLDVRAKAVEAVRFVMKDGLWVASGKGDLPTKTRDRMARDYEIQVNELLAADVPMAAARSQARKTVLDQYREAPAAEAPAPARVNPLDQLRALEEDAASSSEPAIAEASRPAAAAPVRDASKPEQMTPEEFIKNNAGSTLIAEQRSDTVDNAIADRKPINARLFESVFQSEKSRPNTGYVKRGDLYVYEPPSGTTPAAPESPAALAGDGASSPANVALDPAKVSAYATKLPPSTGKLVQDVLLNGKSVEQAVADSGFVGGAVKAQAAVDNSRRFLSTAKTVERVPSARSYEDQPGGREGRPNAPELEALARGESGVSKGPGAASAAEPLVSYEARRFGQRFQDDKSIDPATREATGNRYYEPISNKVTLAEAETIIEQRGTDESIRLVRDEAFPMEYRVRATVAQSLLKKLNQSRAEALKAGDTKSADRFLDESVDVAEYVSEFGTKLGQGVQSFTIWSRLTPEGMLMAAQRGAKKARAKLETEQGPAIQEVIDAVNGAPKGQEFAVLIRLSKTNTIAKRVRSGFDRVVAGAKDGPLDHTKFYAAVSKELGLTEISKATQIKIREMAEEIAGTHEGFQRDEKTGDLLSYIADMKGADPADIPTAMWYSQILSGYTTQMVNTIDTTINVLSESAAMAASHPTAIPDILAGLYRGTIKGGIEAASVLKTGRGKENKLQVPPVLERTRFGQAGGVPVSEATALGRVMKAALEKKPAAIFNLWKYPLRAMVASDTVLYNSFKEARSRVLARVLAKKEGLSGDALFRRVEDVLNRSPEARAAAEVKAKSEGLTGNRLQRRIQEIEQQGRPEELVTSADEAAEIATYNHEPSGVLGVIAHHIGEITSAVPLGRAVVPFTRIVANVTNRGLNYTPWGYKRLFFGQHGGNRFASEPPVGEAYRTQLVKATAGTLGMAAVAALDAADAIQITSNGPDDNDERKQLQASGWKPYSVKIGDTWFSYQYTPLNLGFAMVGHYRDALRYNKLSEKDAQTRLAYGMLRTGTTIFDMSFLSGLSDFMESLSGTASSTKSAGRLIARTATSVLIPNLVKQVDRLFDPTAYEANSVTESLIRETPVTRSQTLKPMLNVLGEPVKLSNNKFFSTAKDDPVWKLIVDKQAFVSVPSKTSKIGDRPITADEYYSLIQKSGPQIRRYIQSNLRRFQSMKAEQVNDAIQAEATKIRAGVKKGL